MSLEPQRSWKSQGRKRQCRRPIVVPSVRRTNEMLVMADNSLIFPSAWRRVSYI
jgi:hypothetical protein